MSQSIARYNVQLTALDKLFRLVLPVSEPPVALRVLCKYLPNETPPAPTIVVVTVKPVPELTPNTLITRNFMLVPGVGPLPDDLVKYIGQVPFGPDKLLATIVEVAGLDESATAEAGHKRTEAVKDNEI